MFFDTLADFEGGFVKDVGAIFSDGVIDEVLDFLINNIAARDEFDESLVEFVIVLCFDDFPDFIGDGFSEGERGVRLRCRQDVNGVDAFSFGHDDNVDYLLWERQPKVNCVLMSSPQQEAFRIPHLISVEQ